MKYPDLEETKFWLDYWVDKINDDVNNLFDVINESYNK